MMDEEKLDDLLVEWGNASEQGRDIPLQELCQNYPKLADEMGSRIRALKAMRWLNDPDDEDDDFLSLPPQLFQPTFTVPAAMSLEQFTASLLASGLLTNDQIQRAEATDANELAAKLIQAKRLTEYQVKRICEGNTAKLVLGNYVILGEIGAGGMGAVYKARHTRMKRHVALKILPDKAVNSPGAVERFHREVEAAARLTHPNIVVAFDADECVGTHFLVMEIVEGEDLSSLVKQHGRLPIGQAVNCIIQAAKGLEYAHNQGVIHRDIKPANLLLGKDGTVKILDMGLARFEEPSGDKGFDASHAELTQDGTVMGTVDYMSPEQALNTHQADARADVYSLGCTLYYLLTGQPIFSGSSLLARLMAHRDEEIPSLLAERDDAPVQLAAIFEKMVAKNSDERYPTMTALLEDLQAIQSEFGDQWQAADAAAKQKTLIESNISSAPRETSSSKIGETLRTVPLVEPQPTIALTSPLQASARRNWRPVIGLIGVIGLVWAASILLKVETSEGTIIVEIDQPELAGAVVSVDGRKRVTLKTGEGAEPIKIAADEKTHMLKVTKGGFETFTQQFTIQAGGEQKIKVRLESLKALAMKPSPVTPQADIVWDDPKVAEWVLAIGGIVRTKENENYRQGDQLPDDHLQVTGIYLPSDGFTDDELSRLVSMESFRHLMIANYLETTLSTKKAGLTGAGLAHIANLTAISELDIGHGTDITDDDIARLRSLQKLKNLTVRRSEPPVTDEGITQLSKLPELESLIIEYSKITGVGLSNFKNLKRLSVLSSPLTSDGIRTIGEMSQLNYLRASLTPLNDVDLEHWRNLTNLTWLDISSTEIADAGVRHLSALAKLQSLNISKTKAADVSLDTIRNYKELTHLEIAYTLVTDTGLEQLRNLTNLTFLSVVGTNVTAEGIASLQKALPKCKILSDFSDDSKDAEASDTDNELMPANP